MRIMNPVVRVPGAGMAHAAEARAGRQVGIENLLYSRSQREIGESYDTCCYLGDAGTGLRRAGY